jgi:hypothetical protein
LAMGRGRRPPLGGECGDSEAPLLLALPHLVPPDLVGREVRGPLRGSGIVDLGAAFVTDPGVDVAGPIGAETEDLLLVVQQPLGPRSICRDDEGDPPRRALMLPPGPADVEVGHPAAGDAREDGRYGS